MDPEKLTCRIVQENTRYTIVRPGITLCLFYAEPSRTLGPAVADILEAYMKFVPAGALQTYLSGKGTWKVATKRTFTTTLAELRDTSEGGPSEFHFGQEPLANVGKYGAHFVGAALDDESFPLETCVLYLEFPFDLSEFSNTSDFVEFVKKVALIHAFDSGYCGCAFNHLRMTFLDDAFEAIGKLALRFIGFDVNDAFIKTYARGRVCNVSWLTLLGEEITNGLGGAGKIGSKLPKGIETLALGKGVMVKAAAAPIVGDVNRGAADAAGLRTVAQLTKPFRVQVANVGPDAPDFAERWLSRFDA